MIYQILKAHFDFRSLNFTEQCRIHLHNRRMEARKLDLNPRSMSLIYDKLELEWHDDDDLPMPDITILSDKLVFSEKAMSALSSILPEHAEQLTYTLDGQEWTLVDLVTPMQSAIDQISDEETIMLAAHDLDEPAILTFSKDQALPEVFNITEPDLRFFCQDQFKTIVEENHLTGIVITENLVTQDYQLVS